MARPLGSPKFGGRKKGTKNKNYLGLMELLEKNNFDPIQVIIDNMPKLTPSEQTKAANDLLPYIYPKKKHVEVEAVGIVADSMQEIVQETTRFLNECFKERK